jgi:hypothetical protein
LLPRLLMRALAIAAVLLCTTTAFADGDPVAPVSSVAAQTQLLAGVVTDSISGVPVEGVLVYVTGTGKLDRTLKTDRAGRYSADVAPGTYYLVFVYGDSRSSGRITVGAGMPAFLDGKVDAAAGEVIIIKEKVAPPVLPKAKNFKPNATPPYSDEAVLSDAWTKAHLLLDVDTRGEVVRAKWLKRPGFKLEQIALKEVFKLKFDPGRDRHGKPVRTWILWTIEWPSAWWLSTFNLPRSTMPPIVGFPPRRMDHYVPCRGSGPLNLGSLHPVYKDCSKPDLKKAATEAWVDASHALR